MLIKGLSSHFIAILERRSKDVVKMSGLTAAVIRHRVDIISQRTETRLVVVGIAVPKTC